MSWEQIQMLTRVFMAGSCVLLVMGDAKTIEYPPVLEGSTVTLSCKGNTTSEDRIIQWKYSTSTTSNNELAKCDLQFRNCSQLVPDKYFAVITNSNSTFNSSLTISAVTRQQEGARFECDIRDTGRADTSNIVTVIIGKVFTRPGNLTCTAAQVTNAFINVTCSASGAYPGMVVEAWHQHNNQRFSEDTLTCKTSDRVKSGQDSVSSCSAVVAVKEPGLYVYHVSVYPGNSPADKVPRFLTYLKTNMVNVSSYVVIEQRSYSLCPGREQTLKFWCTVFLLASAPSFTWLLDNKQQVTTSNISNVTGENYYRQVVEVSHIKESVGKKVTCQVEYKESGTSKKLSAAISLKATWPPSREPELWHRGELIHGHQLDFGEDKFRNGSFECKVQGGRPQVASVNIYCFSTPGSAIIANNSAVGSSVNFTLDYRSIKEGHCSCAAQHESKCYNSTRKFEVRAAPRSRTTTPQLLGSTYIIYYIIAGTIGMILLVLFLGTAMFLRHRWKEIYSYIYFYMSIASSVGGGTFHTEASCPYELMLRRQSSRREEVQLELAEHSKKTGHLLARNEFPREHPTIYVNSRFCSKPDHKSNSSQTSSESTSSSYGEFMVPHQTRSLTATTYSNSRILEKSSRYFINRYSTSSSESYTSESSTYSSETSSKNDSHCSSPPPCKPSVTVYKPQLPVYLWDSHDDASVLYKPQLPVYLWDSHDDASVLDQSQAVIRPICQIGSSSSVISEHTCSSLPTNPKRLCDCLLLSCQTHLGSSPAIFESNYENMSKEHYQNVSRLNSKQNYPSWNNLNEPDRGKTPTQITRVPRITAHDPRPARVRTKAPTACRKHINQRSDTSTTHRKMTTDCLDIYATASKPPRRVRDSRDDYANLQIELPLIPPRIPLQAVDSSKGSQHRNANSSSRLSDRGNREKDEGEEPVYMVPLPPIPL